MFSKQLNRNQWAAILLITLGCMCKESGKVTTFGFQAGDFLASRMDFKILAVRVVVAVFAVLAVLAVLLRGCQLCSGELEFMVPALRANVVLRAGWGLQ